MTTVDTVADTLRCIGKEPTHEELLATLGTDKQGSIDLCLNWRLAHRAGAETPLAGRYILMQDGYTVAGILDSIRLAGTPPEAIYDRIVREKATHGV